MILVLYLAGLRPVSLTACIRLNERYVQERRHRLKFNLTDLLNIPLGNFAQEYRRGACEWFSSSINSSSYAFTIGYLYIFDKTLCYFWAALLSPLWSSTRKKQTEEGYLLSTWQNEQLLIAIPGSDSVLRMTEILHNHPLLAANAQNQQKKPENKRVGGAEEKCTAHAIERYRVSFRFSATKNSSKTLMWEGESTPAFRNSCA